MGATLSGILYSTSCLSETMSAVSFLEVPDASSFASLQKAIHIVDVCRCWNVNRKDGPLFVRAA